MSVTEAELWQLKPIEFAKPQWFVARLGRECAEERRGFSLRRCVSNQTASVIQILRIPEFISN